MEPAKNKGMAVNNRDGYHCLSFPNPNPFQVIG